MGGYVAFYALLPDFNDVLQSYRGIPRQKGWVFI